MQLHNFAYTLLPLLNTSLSGSEILSLAASAPNYINFKIDQMMLPIENDPNGAGKTAPFQGMFYIQESGYNLEVYNVNYYTNVKALQEFILS